MSITDVLAVSDCPACKRYIGKITVCPYCDVEIPIHPTMQRLRVITLIMITVGIPLVWLTALLTATDFQQPSFMNVPDLPGQFYTILKPHFYWILWCGIAWMLLTGNAGTISPQKLGWQELLRANRPIAIEILVFLLGGVTGFMILNSILHNPAIILPGLIPVAGLAALPLVYYIRPRSLLGLWLFPLACAWTGLSPTLAVALQLT